MALNDRRLYRACEADFAGLLHAARELAVTPQTATDICALVERLRAITIQCYPASLHGHPSGLLLRGRPLCLILYERETSPWRQQGIILHECGHLFYEHRGHEVGTAAALRVLMPDVSHDRIAVALPLATGNEGHRPQDERQAEAFATVGLACLSRVRVAPQTPDQEAVRAAPPDDPAVAAVVRRLLEDFAEGQR